MQRLQMMALFVFMSSLPFRVAADDRFAGEWDMTSISFKVVVESWGANCGQRPSSYSSQKKRPVVVTESGGHLIFSDKQVRTDRCGSPNAKIQTVIARRTSTRWKRECRTPKNDPKSEEGVYTLSAINTNRLEYAAESHFDWTLKGDHCVASAFEKRVYIRRQEQAPSKSESETPPAPKLSEADSAQTEPSTCAEMGPPVKIEVQPSEATVGPGEKFCFRAVAVDAKGCQISSGAGFHWSVTQDDVEIPGRIMRTGCFQAGETAAETEGEYTVSARFRGKTGTSTISVVFADLGGLFAARLKPLEDPVIKSELEAGTSQRREGDVVVKGMETKPTKQQATSAVQVPEVAEARQQSDDDGGSAIWWVILTVLGVLGLGGVGFVVIRQTVKRRIKQDLEEFNDWPDEPLGSRRSDPDTRDSAARESTPPTLKCPTCGRQFEMDAKYCPYDKDELERLSSSQQPAANGMICPKCHRGYEADARFCPHDSEPLVPYAEWRISKKTPLQ